ncbi:YycH family regulatory protein [Domibacillus tundrae]|uniref:YycH family regulatory protein n=1 Tax=Domibacillus tundrae TaxID=1587527 RepID=UPI000618024D|nr:two-component system activity regulator YycH [Domibacillus tundrae]
MNYEKIKSAVLALLVLISLAFTWGIWNYQPSYETIADGADDIVTEVEIGQQRKISELVKPSKIISHQGSSHYGTVSEQELDWIMDEMTKWTFFEPEDVSRSLLNKQEFSELLSNDSHVELFFSSSVPFNTIKTMFSFNDTAVPNAVFNRIIITEEENKAFVYFVSVQERLVFRSQIETRSLKEFKNRYVEDSERLKPYISYQIPKGSLLYVQKEPPVLTMQSYLSEQIEEIEAETFKRALFNDPSYVRRGSRSDSDEYTDGSSFMRINSNTGTVRYVNSAETPQSMPLDQLIEKSINFVNDHNGWVDDYRLFKAEPGSSDISYRLFLGDFPVFDSQGMAELSQSWGQDRIYQYDRSSFIVQRDKPLPEETVELQSGQKALNQVINLESIDPLLLTDMRIGYEMTLEQESRKILTLKPFWYYQYNGEWQKLFTDEGRPADGLE